jgi:hypothetical protein
MLLLKADKQTEAGVLPAHDDLAIMGAFNQRMIDAGVLIDGAGLKPTSKGSKVTFRNGKPHVTDGPFAETKEILAGYWLIDVASKNDAIEWARQVPVANIPGDGRDPEIEIREMFEIEDFADVPPAVVEQEKAFASGRTGRK